MTGIARIGLWLLLAAGCAGPVLAQKVKGSGKASEAVSSPADLEKRVRRLEYDVEDLQERVSFRVAHLDCNTGKYDEFMLDTSSLVFFAACTSIEPYLEGHRLTFTIGNPHAFDFSQLKGSLRYGRSVHDPSLKSIELTPLETIRSGSWTRMMVTVNPSAPEELRFLSLSLGARVSSSTR